MRTPLIGHLAAVLISLAMALTARSSTMTNVANVLALSTTPGVKNGDLAFAPGYRMADDRGGGWFIWTNGITRIVPDGGRWIVLTNVGYWSRILKGETANVKMWGAVGNGFTDDTAAFQSAVNACTNVWTHELLVPSGDYRISNTIYFDSGVHIRGEKIGTDDGCRITINRDANIFCSLKAANALKGITNPYPWDEWVLIENLFLYFDPQGTNGAGIVVFNPGENAIIRDVAVSYGGYGIRSLGSGAPGIKVYNAYMDGMFRANISIEGYVGTNWIGAGGEIVLSSISGDHSRPDSDATARFIHINRCYPNVHISDLKAEGRFGGGLIRYDLSRQAGSDALGSVRVNGVSYDCFTNSEQAYVPCDVVVLNADGRRTASVSLDHVELSDDPGVRYLINDSLANRVEYPPSRFTQGRLPIQYESAAVYEDTGVSSRYVVGGSAVCTLRSPQINAWYRVMMWHGHQAAKLVIHTPAESSELNVDIVAGVVGSKINVTRGCLNLDAFNYPSETPRITQVRAGSHASTGSPGGYIGFVDVFVARWPDYNQVGVLAEPLEGLSQLFGDGQTHLFPPTLVTALPSGLVDCVTNSLVR